MENILKSENCITFPVSNKIPKVKNWNTLNKKIKHQNDEGFGALCGQVNGFFVIDCDLIKSDDPNKYVCGVEVWNDLISIIPSYIEIPTVKTKSGGLHLYFKHNPRVKSSVQKYKVCDIFENEVNDKRIVKIDIIADNKYIVCPRTEGYKFINNSGYVEPPNMPEELMDLLFPEITEKIKPILTNTLTTKVNKEQLQQVVQGIPKKHADIRDDWIKIVWGIADTSNKNGFNGLDIADEFSKQSDKYVSMIDVEKIYNQANGSITFGTLLHYSDNKTFNINNQTKNDIDKTILMEDINNNLPLDIREIVNIKDDEDKKICELVTVDGEKINLIVHTKNIAATKDDQFLGYLQKLLSIKYDLSVIHTEFKDNCEVIFIDQHTLDFVYRDKNSGEHRIRVKHPWENSKRYFTKYSHGKQLGSMRRNKQELAVIIDEALKNACVSHLQDKYNLTVNINITNNNYFGQNDDSIRSDEVLITELIKSHPGIVDSFKFCDTGNMSGIYLYGPNTGIWRKEHNGTIEKMLSSRLRNYVPMLTEKEIKYIGTNKNIQQLRQMFIKEIIDQDFEKKIDENRNIFACTNGVYDIEKQTFRRSIPHDFVYTNCGWDYNEKDAELYMEDVKDFFKKLFPIQEEYEVVLTYIASFIHGYRLDKKFLALTDKRNGNNGKSTLIALIRRFFGDYMKTSNKFLLKGAFDKDKDSHDGGLEPLKGKRILVCDELKKNMRLDEGLIKNLAGGEYMVQGRKLGKSTQFQFMWQSGIIMIFNEGDCPKFDSTDNAFMERLVIVPMRSKFVVDEENVSTFTFKRDADITSKFNLWRSSLLKLFISYCPDTKGLTNANIPKSMCDWKSEIVSENNELNDWLFSVVKENKNSFVKITDIKDKYKQDFPHDRHTKNKDLERMINCLFNNKGIYIKEIFNHLKENSENKTTSRNVFIGYELI